MANGDRVLDILYRAMRGEYISVRHLANQYDVSTKSISRDIARIKDFLAENRELTNNAELEYCHSNKAYRLTSDENVTAQELFAMAKALLGTRAFSKAEAQRLIGKFKRLTTAHDRKMLDEIVGKELLHYSQVNHDCESVTDILWRLINLIHHKREVTLHYYKTSRSLTEKTIQPVSIIFMEYYFYLIAFYPDRPSEPRYFRVDRIKALIEHRRPFDADKLPNFDEGLLRNRCQFMFYGELRRVRFEYWGSSVQAILDRLPTAKIVDRHRKTYTIEAEVHGDGIKMYLLSQGAWVKVLSPPEFVEEIRAEIVKMSRMYGDEKL